MAAPGFGFSFGDFVAAIKIVKDVGRALRETGGAKDEFQHVLLDLQHLEILLEQLHHGTWDHGGDAGHLNAIKGMALTCQVPLEEFLKKVGKYKALRQPYLKGLKARLENETRKVQWAIGMREEVEKFRAVIVAKMVSINLLIHLHTFSAISKLGSQTRVLTETSGSSQSQVQARQEEVTHLSRELRNVTLQQTHMKNSISTLVQICAGTKVGLERFRVVDRMQHREIRQRLDKLQQMHDRGNVMIVSNSQAMNKLEAVVRQLVGAFGEVSGAMLRLLGSILRTDLEMYALLKQMHGTMLRMPPFQDQDSLQFTDALGRKKTLPYEYFRHWDVFESMLKCEFKQLPGEMLVAQGKYHLLNTRRKDLVIQPGRWEATVFPGADISMSIIILGLLFNKGSCPRVACGARNALPSGGSTFIICSKCNLEYHYFENSVQRNVGVEEVVGRRGHSLPDEGQNMFRSDGRRPQTDISFGNLDLQMPPFFEVSAKDELEAFKSIHIQTKSDIDLSGEGRLKNDDEEDDSHNKGGLPTTVIQTLAPDGSTISPQIPSDPPHAILFTPESRIGKFLGESLQLKSILGTGTYGAIYLAYDHSTQTRYTIKALNKTNLAGEPLDRRQQEFHAQEIQLHYAASAHPNIVSMVKIIDDTDCTYVILEYCPDGDLFSNIVERGKYVGSDALIREAFLQILDAVEHCHRLGIYHRDLTPESILVSGSDVLLTNFGLATTDPESEDTGCGVNFYMSPECLAEYGTYKCAPNDIWSLGVILVNLTTGRNPWKQASIQDSTYEAFLGDPDFLKSILPLSDELNNILGKTFAADPERRINIADLKEAIRNCRNFTVPNMSPSSGIHFESEMSIDRDVETLSSTSTRSKNPPQIA